jgi:hypothetical protein
MHLQSDSIFLFPPIVFASTLRRNVFPFESEAMKEYERPITIQIEVEKIPGKLKIVRLPWSWHAFVWVNPLHYAAFGQEAFDLEGLNERDFLSAVQVFAASESGVDFEYASVN